MASPFVGQIILFACNFAPRSFALCNGQLLSISQNTALFSLLGTQFGGNGTTNFALPNLQSAVPIHQHQGPGLTSHNVGESFGSESITLITNEMPAHAHSMSHTLTATPTCRNAAGNQTMPVGNVPAIEAAGVTATYSDAPPDANMRAGIPVGGSAAASIVGGSQPHDNRQPYLTLNYCIALNGVFPARN
jgi:microcystin-dependent protein